MNPYGKTPPETQLSVHRARTAFQTNKHVFFHLSLIIYSNVQQRLNIKSYEFVNIVCIRRILH